MTRKDPNELKRQIQLREEEICFDFSIYHHYTGVNAKGKDTVYTRRWQSTVSRTKKKKKRHPFDGSVDEMSQSEREDDDSS